MSDNQSPEEKQQAAYFATLEAEARAARPEAARHVLWHNGDPRGVQPGSFTEKLLDAWARADQDNASRLAYAFPHLATAVEISHTQGSDALAAWAGIE